MRTCVSLTTRKIDTRWRNRWIPFIPCQRHLEIVGYRRRARARARHRFISLSKGWNECRVL